MDFGKGVKKGKKKQVKDELDRIKQAEKKKRRLEKALATSAAIISELEKKKQKKKEEQKRLDEEGAAIAEAVALQVLIGEDTDEECGSNFDDLFGGGTGSNRPYIYRRSGNGNGWILKNGGWGEDGCLEYVDEISAQAVSGLQIADDEDTNGYVYKRMVRG
ncbi:uncharacterized protein LOC112509522 [Cynara cardunculus var. scolymus]|uniref:Uncharacterized protein n=1 Tax=Cynara cardunculus var. scolymus TaxID=59895 RepID=A0A103YDL1_CYNCS|nr:uncharacterized protein LOC112509522 [Cynara cardunculus var. scolymus]XP_024970287.1 uncharacterized protein LOC112509522 [Cynara cardunculus var. scolymus]KVI07132.1 hypothetical protein Ccrd_014512 [Cynara cardunculus var. scolymus]